MTWVPPYAVAKCRDQLDKSQAGDTITHLALQFWVPTKMGTVAIVKSPEVTEREVAEIRNWAHARGVKILLCIFNGAEKWDWGLAKSAFADHQQTFAENLVAEMEREKLDGIDIDLEGPGSFDSDEPAFVAFIASLSKAVHSHGKQLTVDSFCYKWNAPNQGWWSDLLPLVDALTSMGYEETGSSAPGWRSYAEQSKAAKNAAKLQIGVPSGKDQWQGNTVLEHLEWIEKDGGSGVAIWDAQFQSPAWRSRELWQVLRRVRR